MPVKKYVYGLWLDSDLQFETDPDELYDTDNEDYNEALIFFVQAYDLSVEDMQKATVKLISIQE